MIKNKKEIALITEAVKRAEQLTEAEIKVVIENRAGNILTQFNPFDSRKKASRRRSRKVFKSCKLTKTKNRNAVLLYFALREKRFEILADTNAHAVLGQKLLDNIVIEVTSSFAKSGVSSTVIVKVIDGIAQKLARLYPSVDNTTNDLPDDPIIR